MAPPHKRFTNVPTSRRYLALRHRRRKAAIALGELSVADELPPGYKQLFSFDRPGLLGGTYTIKVKQSISSAPRDENDKNAPPPDLAPTCSREFEVLAPRYEIPADAVYSVYPESGATVTHDTLAHIVFNDISLPWERAGSPYAEDYPPGDFGSNRVPWVALLVFSPDELRLELPELNKILEATTVKGDAAKQSDSLAVKVPIADLGKLACLTPLTDPEGATKPDTTVIFPTARLFNGLFATYNSENKQRASPQGGPDLSRHRFLAHGMRINTAGMAEADRNDGLQQIREFSVVLGNRTGPLDGDKPAPMIAHLVSIEGIESIRPFPLEFTGDGRSRVALVSLHSWAFTSLPPKLGFSVSEAFHNLAEGAQMLYPQLLDAPTNLKPTEQRLHARLKGGFTMLRSRPATGEETAALLRGPLTPNVVPRIPWRLLSSTGSSLQILDKGLGVMDITYSAAWALGRTLALADRSYTTALTRVRHQILKAGTDAARAQMVRATAREHYGGRKDLVLTLQSMVKSAVDMSASPSQPAWIRPVSLAPDLSYTALAPSFLEQALEDAAYQVSSSTSATPDDWTLSYAPPYDEMNDPASSDWMVVLRFVLDLYYLVNVRAHYLPTDRSHLPTESLRFFFIDQNWVDALVDGALSLGNQGGTDADADDNDEDDDDASTNAEAPEGAPIDDPVRRAIKKAINRFFDEPLCLKHRPAIPRFGFYLRSQIVSKFPDLRVSVQPENLAAAPDRGPMLLRHEVIDKETMLGFFSADPLTSTGLQGLRFEVPAHQQTFTAAQTVTAEGMTASYRRQYTVAEPADQARNQPVAKISWPRNAQGGRIDAGKEHDLRRRDPFFVWGLTPTAGDNDLRMLLVEKMADDLHTTLTDEMGRIQKTWYTETCATSAVTAHQLSSPSWQLDIGNMPALRLQAAALGRISGRLSYREAPEADEGQVQIQKVHAKLPLRLPAIEELRLHPGLRRHAPPPHARNLPIPASSSPPMVIDNIQSHRGHARKDSTWSIISTPSTVSFSSDSGSDSEFSRRAGLPVFTYRVSSTSHPGVNAIPMLSTRQDLIFSIVYASGGLHFRLEMLTISIPVQAPAPRNNLLQGSGAGVARQGVRMVSNLRFNVRASYSSAEGSLDLTLVPRSRDGRKYGVPMEKWIGEEVGGEEGDTREPRRTKLWERSEISVVLYGVKVKEYKGGDDCEVYVTPKYANNPTPTRTSVWALLRDKKEVDQMAQGSKRARA